VVRPRMVRFDLDTIGAFAAPSSSININLRKLAAMGAKKKEGQILKVARLIISLDCTLDTTSTMEGVVDGRRLYEMIQRVQLAPAGWPVDYSHDAGGKALRRYGINMRGHIHNKDPLNLADGVAADSAFRLIVPLDFWHERAVRPEDTCPPAVHVGEGSLQMAIENFPTITGFSDGKIACGRVIAECFFGDPEVPVFKRFRERSLGVTPQRFDLNVNCDRLPSAWLQCHYGKITTNTHLEGTFEESRTIQMELDGVRVIEDITIQELVEGYNREALSDAQEEVTAGAALVGNTGAAIDPLLPTIVPLLIHYGRHNEKNTKLPRGTNMSFVEASAQLQDTATGATIPIDLLTEEYYEPKRGGRNVTEFLRAGKADGPVDFKRKTLSKVRPIAAHKAGAVPLKIVPTNKLPSDSLSK